MDDQILGPFTPPLNCPDCGSPLPRLQSPFTKTRRQWAEGGYLCPDCGCETDLAGQKVAPGTGPRPGWAARSVLLTLPAVVVAAVLVFFAIHLSAQDPEPPLAPGAPPAVPAAAVPEPAAQPGLR